MSTLEQLKNELTRHDWTHDFSDDHRYWLAGTRHQQIIQAMIDELAINNEEIVEETVAKATQKYGTRFSIKDKTIEPRGD